MLDSDWAEWVSKLVGETRSCDFRHSPQRDEEYKKQVADLPRRLQELIRGLKKLHPRHRVVLETQTTFAIFLREEGMSGYLAACYIDTSSSGIIKLILRGRGIEETTERFILDSDGKREYPFWHYKDKWLYHSVGDEILQRLLETAIVSLNADRLAYLSVEG